MVFLKNLGRARERFQGLSAPTRAAFVLSIVLIFFWLATTLWFITKEQAEFLTKLQIDKIMHFAGGIFFAGFVFITSQGTRRSALIGSVFLAGILWEIWEVIFLPDQLARFRIEFVLWTADSLFDVAADILGAYFFYDLSEYGKTLYD